MKKGLVLESGAMRGMFICGALDVFMENGVTFDDAVGISAGAVFGCNFKSKWIGRGGRYNKKYGKDPRYCSMKCLRKTEDLYNVEFCCHELPEKSDSFDKATFEANPMEFYVGATDVDTAECCYYKCVDGVDSAFAVFPNPFFERRVGNFFLDAESRVSEASFSSLEDEGLLLLGRSHDVLGPLRVSQMVTSL